MIGEMQSTFTAPPDNKDQKTGTQGQDYPMGYEQKWS